MLRPRFTRASTALLAVACGSSSGGALFSGKDDFPARDASADVGTISSAGGRVPTGNGGASGGRPAGGAAGAVGAGGRAQSGGTPGAGGRVGAGGMRATGGAVTGGAGSAGTGGSATGGAATGGAGTAGSGGTAGSAGTAAGGADGGTSGGGSGGIVGAGGSPGTPTPGIVACGTTTCTIGDVLQSACCVSALPQATVCIPTLGAGCANVGTIVACDDAADCMNGQVCCASMPGGAGTTPTAACEMTQCKDGARQLCRTDAECRGKGTCQRAPEQPEYSVCR
jgi:hypothetical protein